jgi:hypothetical protein
LGTSIVACLPFLRSWFLYSYRREEVLCAHQGYNGSVRPSSLSPLFPIAQIEQIHRMINPQPLALLLRLAGNLQDAAGVGGDDGVSAGAENVLQFAPA